MSDYILYQSVPLFSSSQSVLTSFFHSLLTSLFSSKHISSVQLSALDIQHFLKLFTFTSGEKCCHAIMICIDCCVNSTYIFLVVVTYLNPMKIQNFLHTLLVVLRILNTCVLDFYVVSVVWSVLSSWHFLMILYLWIVQVLFLSLVVNF